MMKPENFQAWMPTVIKLVALGGVAWQTLVEEFDRPYLLALFGAMLGLGEVVSAATSRGTNGKKEKEETSGDS